MGDEGSGYPGFEFTSDRYELVSLVERVTEDNEELALFGVTDVVELDGGFVLSDARNHRLVRLSPQLAFMSQIGGVGQGPGEYQMPGTLAVEDGRVIVLDEGNARLSWLTTLDGYERSLQLGGTVNHMALHPRLGAFVVSSQFRGHYLARVSADTVVAFGTVPPELLSDGRASALLTNDYVAVTPDGQVHVLDEPGATLVSYAATGEQVAVRYLPESFRLAKLRERESFMEAFGSGLMGLALIADFSAMPDGRLFVLAAEEDLLGMVLDVEANTATPLVKGPAPELSWVPGGSAALFDGRRLVLTNMAEIAIFETRLVPGAN